MNKDKKVPITPSEQGQMKISLLLEGWSEEDAEKIIKDQLPKPVKRREVKELPDQ